MTDYPQWSTVKAQLDDPSVSGADKQRLLNDYAQSAAYGSPFEGTIFAGDQQATNQDYVSHYAQIMQYAQQYGSTDSFNQAAQVNGTGFFGDQLVKANQAAGQAKFQAQQQLVQNDQAVGQANTDLGNEANKTVAQGGSGASTSDEILEPGSRGMYYFQYFIPPYQNWVGSAPDLDNDIKKVYDNLRGINFAKFRADATQLATSHGKLSDSSLNLSTATNSLGGFWQGPAAQAAGQYTNTFMQNAKTVTDGTTAAGQLITDQLKAIETAVLQRAQAVLKMYASDIGGFGPSDIQQIIDAAKLNANDDELRGMAKWNVFSNVDWGDTDCNGSLSQNVKNLASMDATNWLNSVFKPNFDQKKTSFDSITKSTHDTVGQSFDAMNQGLGKINANPFSDLSQGIQVPTATTTPTSSGPSSGSSPGSTSGSSTGGSTAPSSAPSVPTPTPPTVPQTPAPTVPTPPTTGPTPPLTTVPSGTDTGNTTSTPPESLTVQHGSNTLSMTGPNSQGTMQLTTQDGTGQPKSYDIAFGHGATPTPTTTATPAHMSIPAGASNVQHITPGADGKAVIHDGNTTITAQEQPGGEVKVTVDDGSGQPTTYTLDHAGAQPTPATGATATSTAQGIADPTATSTAAHAQPVGDPATPAANSATPVAASGPAAGAQAPATLVSDTSQQAGFIDPSAMPQTTQPATTGDPGALVGGTDNSAFAQGFSDPSSSFGNALGGAVGGSHAAAAFFGPQHGSHDMFGGTAVPGHAGVAGTDVTPMGQPGGAGLAAAPDGAPDQGQQGQPSQMGGMPMMGGMGGGGGQGGGDQQRGPNQWRTQGQLFDDADEVVGRFSGTLDDGR
ncbi:MAG TPA: hypothetical protein VGL06_15970 [Pseudonocardiaceae bacterium]